MVNVTILPVNQILENPDNPRKNIGDISELAESIKVNGIMQNLTVFPVPKEKETDEQMYMLLIGHRRLAACKAAGLSEIPCNIKEMPSRAEQIKIMLSENMQRNDLTYEEEAQSFQLCLDLGESVDSIAERTGFSKTKIRSRLKIAKLDPEALAKHRENGDFQLSITDLDILSTVPDIGKRNEILNSARSSAEVRTKVQNALDDIEIDKRAERWIQILQDAGFKELPNKDRYNIYMNKKFESANFYQGYLGNEIPDEVQLPSPKSHHGDGYYFRNYNNISIYFAVTGKRELSPYEVEEKKKEADTKQIRNIKRDIVRKLQNIAAMVCDGKLPMPENKKDPALLSLVWETAALASVQIYHKTMWMVYTGRSADKFYKYQQDKEKRVILEEEMRKIKSLPIWKQLMLLLVDSFKSKDIVMYGVRYTSNPDVLYKIVDIFTLFGLVLEEEEKHVLMGTSPLYRK